MLRALYLIQLFAVAVYCCLYYMYPALFVERLSILNPRIVKMGPGLQTLVRTNLCLSRDVIDQVTVGLIIYGFL